MPGRLGGEVPGVGSNNAKERIVRAIHERIAAIGLRAVEQYGFVLAGGYAISANGIGDRPSMDVDLFTNGFDLHQFAQAVDQVREAFDAAGFDAKDKTIGPTFADMRVTDRVTGEFSDIQLGANYREFLPARIAIGPVLDIRDAVAGKMSALWSRGEVRDFIDIDAVISSGRFTREEVLEIGDRQEFLPMDREILTGRFRGVVRWSTEEFATYRVDAAGRERIIANFTDWADQIDPRGRQGES
jgi:hypothetical protein